MVEHRSPKPRTRVRFLAPPPSSRETRLRWASPQNGSVAEWLKAPVLKTGSRASGSEVRILPLPKIKNPLGGFRSAQVQKHMRLSN